MPTLKPPTRRKPQVREPEIGVLDFGPATFVHEGILFTGKCAFDLNKPLEKRQFNDLQKQRGELAKRQDQQRRELLAQGVMNAQVAPIHEILDENNLPEGYQLYADPARAEKTPSPE